MISTGLDALIDSQFELLRGKRVGLFTNPSAVNRDLASAYDIFRRAHAESAFQLAALFAPEHGFAGAVREGELIASGVDPRTSIPIHSLYGAHEAARPTSDMLAGLDVLVCDIQDIGVRYYTFTWTISHVIEACGAYGIRVVILDRPNPLGGATIDGPLLDSGVSSIVGRFPVPVRHSLTLGEMAQLINGEWNPTPAELTVIPCPNWKRDLVWAQTGLTWISPSPNMPHLSTLQHYPGACLIEGTNLSEGRGTALPFEIVGAPFVDGAALAEQLNAHEWPGVRFRPHTFQPSASKWAGEMCAGVQVHVTDAETFRPIHTWLGVIMSLREMYPSEFEWKTSHIDRLIGSDSVRLAIEVGELLEAITAGWESACQGFAETRRPYLLYD